MIFISYRREDTSQVALVLHELLAEAIGDRNVFLDTADIRGGDEWPAVIDRAADNSVVTIVLIGPSWLTLKRDGKPRLDHEDDWVRREIASALKRKIPLLPIQLEPAEPKLDKMKLPEDIAGLAKHQVTRVRGNEALRSDLLGVVRRIQALVLEPRRRITRRVLGLCALVAALALAAWWWWPDPPPTKAQQRFFDKLPIADRTDAALPFALSVEAADLLESDDDSVAYTTATAVVIPTKWNLGPPHKPSLDCFLSREMCGLGQGSCTPSMDWGDCAYLEARQQKEPAADRWAEVANENVRLAGRRVIYAAGIDATRGTTGDQIQYLSQAAVEASADTVQHLAIPLLGGGPGGGLEKDESLKAMVTGIRCATAGPKKVTIVFYTSAHFFERAASDELETMDRCSRS